MEVELQQQIERPQTLIAHTPAKNCDICPCSGPEPRELVCAIGSAWPHSGVTFSQRVDCGPRLDEQGEQWSLFCVLYAVCVGQFYLKEQCVWSRD